MAIQVRANNVNVPFILFGDGFNEADAVLEQDAGRSAVLAYGTVMGKVAATQKWAPVTSLIATDGSSIPLGIYVGPEVAAALLVAGDISDSPIFTGGNCTVDGTQLVLENSLTLASVITGSAITALTVKDYLAYVGIYVEGTVATSASENA